jgi:hypothetical protein
MFYAEIKWRLHQECGRPFQVIIYGRFWVFTEEQETESPEFSIWRWENGLNAEVLCYVTDNRHTATGRAGELAVNQRGALFRRDRVWLPKRNSLHNRKQRIFAGEFDGWCALRTDDPPSGDSANILRREISLLVTAIG